MAYKLRMKYLANFPEIEKDRFRTRSVYDTRLKVLLVEVTWPKYLTPAPIGTSIKRSFQFTRRHLA